MFLPLSPHPPPPGLSSKVWNTDLDSVDRTPFCHHTDEGVNRRLVNFSRSYAVFGFHAEGPLFVGNFPQLDSNSRVEIALGMFVRITAQLMLT